MLGKVSNELLNAYQEGLLSIEQLRERMPALRKRQQTLLAELEAIADQANDRAAFLRLAETLTAFLTRLRSAAESLSVIERQKIVRESFARAQELLQQNKIRSRRRTIAPSVVQGLVSCAKCGYAFSRTSTRRDAPRT